LGGTWLNAVVVNGQAKLSQSGQDPLRQGATSANFQQAQGAILRPLFGQGTEPRQERFRQTAESAAEGWRRFGIANPAAQAFRQSLTGAGKPGEVRRQCGLLCQDRLPYVAWWG
jgi:hypothetical protein